MRVLQQVLYSANPPTEPQRFRRILRFSKKQFLEIALNTVNSEKKTKGVENSGEGKTYPLAKSGLGPPPPTMIRFPPFVARVGHHWERPVQNPAEPSKKPSQRAGFKNPYENKISRESLRGSCVLEMVTLRNGTDVRQCCDPGRVLERGFRASSPKQETKKILVCGQNYSGQKKAHKHKCFWPVTPPVTTGSPDREARGQSLCAILGTQGT